jgi:hypothetical protein
MASKLFAPKSHPVRLPSMTGRRNGQVINPPRLPEIGGMTERNTDQKEPELMLSKPGNTKAG